MNFEGSKLKKCPDKGNKGTGPDSDKLVLNDGDSRFWVSARKVQFQDSYVV
jgi:hypothetical protein